MKHHRAGSGWLVAGLAAFALVSLPFVAAAAPTVSDITLEQVDWLRPDGSVALADSMWGRLSFNSTPDASATHYLNITAANGSTSAWSVQNLPITAFVSGRQTIDLNLAELGVSSGTNLTNLQLSISVDAGLRTVAPGASFASFGVADYQRQSWDEFGITSPFDPGAPKGIKLGSVLAGPGVAERVFNPLEEDENGCMPGSFARSLDWINRQYGRGSTKTVQNIYSDLATLIGLPPAAPREELRIERKAGYAQALMGVETKVFDAGNFLDPIFGVRETAPTGDTYDDFIDWLMSEFAHGEDIEIRVTWKVLATGEIGGHIVSLVDLQKTAGGQVIAKYRDDSKQGKPGGDDATKWAEIFRLPDGRIAWGAEDASWTIDYAVSESVVPEPDAKLLVLAGLLALLLSSPAASGFARPPNKR